MTNKDWKPPHINQDDCEHESTYATTYGSMRSYETFTHKGAFCAKCGKDMRRPPPTAKDYGASYKVDRKDVTQEESPRLKAMRESLKRSMDKMVMDEFFKAHGYDEDGKRPKDPVDCLYCLDKEHHDKLVPNNTVPFESAYTCVCHLNKKKEG